MTKTREKRAREVFRRRESGGGGGGAGNRKNIACVASVSVNFSARSRHFSLFGGAKIGAIAVVRCTQFSRVQKAKNASNLWKPLRKCLLRWQGETEKISTL